MRTMTVIVDLQFGSCGKGLLAGYLAKKEAPDTVITAWAPNAGHTYMEREFPLDVESGHVLKMVNIALPNGIISPNIKRVMLGPGSVINPQLLMTEMEEYHHYLNGVQLVIHEHAAVVHERHREQEAAYGFRIGSTMKGVGAALIEKSRRDPTQRNTAKTALLGTPLEGYVVDGPTWNSMLDSANNILIEGAQGYSLGINSGFYPYTTSRECTYHQLMVDCAIPRWLENRYSKHVVGVCRTFPIRVANRYDEHGERIGWSGPCYSDQEEIQWQEIGLEPELTTVTRLPRRLFTFSFEQIYDAIRANDVDSVFLNFANYLPKLVRGQEITTRGIIDEINRASTKHPTHLVKWVGFGPYADQIKEV